MKILLIGKTGQLGGDIIKNGENKFEIISPGRETLDIGNIGDIEYNINAIKPDIVINTAAFHNVPLCETEHVTAFNINCVAVRNLAKCCKSINALFVTFSTDYVFDGKKKEPYIEDDKAVPLQIYGISKLAGELAALSTWPEKTIIIRTCGLYGISGAQSKGGNFVDKRIQDARLKSNIDMGSDQVVCPTSTEDLSKSVLQLIEIENLNPGIYHLVNEGECNWHEFAKAIYEIMKLNVTVNPVDRKGLTGEMRRPLYSVLSNTKAKSHGIILPHWRNALEDYINKKYHK